MKKKELMIIDNYAFVTNPEITGVIDNRNSVMYVMPTTGACQKNDIRVIGAVNGVPYVTDCIERVCRRKSDTSMTGSGKENSVTIKVGTPHKCYLEFMAAKENGISVLNAAFMVEVDRPAMCTRIKIAYEHLADEVSMKFNGRKIVAQHQNFVLLDDGNIGWINWLCLVRSRRGSFMHPFCGDAELQEICKDNKRFRGPNGPIKGYIDIKPYEFIGDEVGYHLLCDQVKNFNELLNRAEMLKK